MSYMGQTTLKASDIRRVDVTSSTSATHTLTWEAPNEQSLIVTINGVKQQNNYTVSGTTLTLDTALVATDALEVIGINDIGTTITPAEGSVNTAQLANDAVTADKLAAGLANATHTGDVTGATALTIATDAVDIAMLSATGTADATTFLRGDNAWAVPSDNGKILQVVSTNMNTTFTYTGVTYSDVTGLSLSITPSSTSSKILVSYDTVSATTGTYKYFLKVVRLIGVTTTDLGLPAAAGSRILGQIGAHGWNTVAPDMVGSFTFLDSPSTTSAITYKVQVSTEGAWYLNRSVDDTDNANFGRYVSNITAMEVGV